MYDKTIDDNVYTYYFYAAGFTVVATPPTLPPLGNPAFSWQGSVAGVNTGNGNKTTTVPITGWTMRGGMHVSCALYHNSQGPQYGGYGNKWLCSYFDYLTSDGSGKITVHWDNGLSYTFTANSDGVTYTAPIGILDRLSSSSGTFRLTTPDQTVYTFGFVSGNAYLSSITDLDGNTLSIGHNSDTTISTVSDPNGRTLTYAYSGGHLVSVTDPLNRVWTIAYNTIGGSNGNNVWYVALPPLNGQTYASWYGYDGNNNITSTHSPQGHVTNATSMFGYDGSGRLLWAQDPLGNRTTFTYNADNTVITDPNGHTTKHTYAYSQLKSVTDALGNTSYSNYDVDNILSSTKDKRGHTWSSSSHFSNGTSMSTSTTPLGFSSSVTYSADGKNKVVHSVDALNNATDNTYSTDGKDDLLTTSITGTGSAPFKATSKVGGYTNGLPTTFTDALNNPSSVAYDSHGYGYVSSATDANGHTSTATFDVLGFKLSSTDANLNSTKYTPDNWERVTDIEAADHTHTKMDYDLNGNVHTVTDANNHVVTNSYDADDRLTQTVKGNGDTVSYTYDGTDIITGAAQKGLLTSKTDGNGHTTYYTYTDRNEPLATYYADGTHESVTYDEIGNTKTRTKADGNVITYEYDNDDRLTKITYPHLTATTFSYDADGRKTGMTDATGTTSWYYGYDGVHMTTQTTPQGSVSYGFDADGRRKAMELSGTPPDWVYTYDAGGRLTKLQNPYSEVTTFSYDAANRLTQQVNGDGTYQTFVYDAANQETDIWYYTGGGGVLGHLLYAHDPAGNISQTTQNTNVVTSYGYDGSDQLTSESHTGDGLDYALGFTYDHNGNRLTQTRNGAQVQSFTYDAHDKTLSATGETDTWDLNGNEKSVTLGGSLYQMRWDDEDRLVGETNPYGTVDTFVYNGLGLRVGKTDSTGTYSYICDGTSPNAPVLSDGHQVYTPGLSRRLGAASTFSHPDFLGSLRFQTDSSQNVTANLLSDAFGEGVSQSGPLGTPFAWLGGNGSQTDTDISFVQMGHRFYDTRIGRFISQDPAGDGDNWYAYADNSPVNEIDPEGLDAILPGGDPYPTFGGGPITEGLKSPGPGQDGSLWDQMNTPMSGGSPGAGIMIPVQPQPHQKPPWWMQAAHDFYQAAIHPISPIPGVGPGPSGQDWAKISGIIRDANKGKGNFGLGSATRAEADAAGKAWVGDGYTLSSNGKAWISQNKLRQYRPASYKPKRGMEQANLEQRYVDKGEWQSNGHIDIVP